MVTRPGSHGPDEPHRVWDPGLQNERTAIAWQRTLLALVASALVLARLVATYSRPAAAIAAAAAVALGLVLGVLTSARYRRQQLRLHAERPIGDARAPLVVAALLATVGAITLGYVVLTWR